MNSFDSYCLFLALKQHFATPKYDYIKYNGKVRSTLDSFEKRKDGYLFRKLGALPDPKSRIIACLLNDITWINDVLSVKGAKAESDYTKSTQTLSHALKSFLGGFNQPLQELIKPSKNAYPVFAELLIENRMPIQYIIVLDDLLKFLPSWNDQFSDILWEPYQKKIDKYRPFFDYDKLKMKKIFLEWAEGNR